MKILKTCLLAVVLAFTVTSCSKDGDVVVEEANYSIDLNLAKETDWQMANEILELVNTHRASVGLTAVKRDQQHASALAVDHTQYMIEMSQINHDNFDQRTRAMKGQGAATVGENVASGYTSAEALVNAWKNSPSHLRVMEGNYTHSGFGVVKNAQGKYYYTQLFYRK